MPFPYHHSPVEGDKGRYVHVCVCVCVCVCMCVCVCVCVHILGLAETDHFLGYRV